MFVNQLALVVIEAERYSIFILMMEIMFMKRQLLIPFKTFTLWPDQIEPYIYILKARIQNIDVKKLKKKHSILFSKEDP